MFTSSFSEPASLVCFDLFFLYVFVSENLPSLANTMWDSEVFQLACNTKLMQGNQELQIPMLNYFFWLLRKLCLYFYLN